MIKKERKMFMDKMIFGVEKIPILPPTHNCEKPKVISKPFVTQYDSFFSFRYVDEF